MAAVAPDLGGRMLTSLAELCAPIAEPDSGEDALVFWRWLAGAEVKPFLVTALGDPFLEGATGVVAFLDTYEGRIKPVAANRRAMEQALTEAKNLEAWFSPTLVRALRQRGLVLKKDECYSPKHPLVLGGTMEPGNFEVTSWRLHVGLMGQIYEQSRNLPPGTVIRGFTSK
jgi:hypothetical protein